MIHPAPGSVGGGTVERRAMQCRLCACFSSRQATSRLSIFWVLFNALWLPPRSRRTLSHLLRIEEGSAAPVPVVLICKLSFSIKYYSYHMILSMMAHVCLTGVKTGRGSTAV